jgi:hypothetical protein
VACFDTLTHTAHPREAAQCVVAAAAACWVMAIRRKLSQGIYIQEGGERESARAAGLVHGYPPKSCVKIYRERVGAGGGDDIERGSGVRERERVRTAGYRILGTYTHTQGTYTHT